MKLFCKLNFHNWDNRKIEDMEHRPCYRYRTCKTCGKEERFLGWHRFENFGDVTYTRVSVTYWEEEVSSYIESKQGRICKDCKLRDEVLLQ